MAMRIAEMAALGQNSEICQHTEREDIPCQLLTPAEPAVAETAHNARADARESVLSQSHVVYRVKTRRPVSHTHYRQHSSRSYRSTKIDLLLVLAKSAQMAIPRMPCANRHILAQPQ